MNTKDAEKLICPKSIGHTVTTCYTVECIAWKDTTISYNTELREELDVPPAEPQGYCAVSI